MHPNDTLGIATSVDPDQTTPSTKRYMHTDDDAVTCKCIHFVILAKGHKYAQKLPIHLMYNVEL